jgi:hypothetical protein
MARIVAVVLLGCVWVCGPLRVEACLRVPDTVQAPGPTVAARCAAIKRSQAVLRAFRKAHPCPATGLTTGPCAGWVIDHQIPLCLCGLECDVQFNLHWQDEVTAKIKDRLEKKLCRLQPRPCAHLGD